MATYEVEIEGLTSLSIDGSSAPTQDELSQFLTQGAKEIINHLPKHLLPLCSSEQSFTSGSADTLSTGKVLSVFRSDGDIKQPCRQIDSSYKGRVLDSDDMDYATVTDPVYYIENSAVDVLPGGGSVTYSEVQYPTVSYTAGAVAVFPDEAEYLVPLYASVKSLQNVLGSRSSNSDITTAFGLLKTAVDQAATAADKFEVANTSSIFGDTYTFDATNSSIERADVALNQAENVINNDEPSSTTDAYAAQVAEDFEMVSSALNIAKTEMSRAQTEIQHWVAMGDMRAKQVNVALSEAQGYASEIQSRLAVDSSQYSWYEKQQAKLQGDYDKGLQMLKGANA